MVASRFLVLVLAAWSSPLSAQERAQGLLRPITAPVKYAGVYHLGTGTWTQAGAPGTGGSAPASSTGPGIIYDNSCDWAYYAGMSQFAIYLDEGRLPSTSSQVRPNVWGPGNDSEVGTQDTYTIDGFQIAYCTSENTPRSYLMRFCEAYDACSPSPATATATILVSGLPASSAAGTQACWMVDIDLCASSQSFDMLADADQIYDGLPTGVHDTFGWSFQLVSPAPHNGDGFLFAGGRVVSGSPQTCPGADGSVFDTSSLSPIYPANSDAIALACGSLGAGAAPEEGSGIGSQDRFRIENSPPTQDGCYWMNVVPFNLHLQLYSADVALPNNSPSVPFCDPGSAGVIACPCANPPAGTLRGCDNSAATGGAALNSTGVASLAADSLVFTTAGEPSISSTILVQGPSTLPSGAIFAQGVRCVGGPLKRLYVHPASGGSFTAPAPGDPSVSARSTALGDSIASGTQRYYFAMYRDPAVLGGCPATWTFNSTNANAVLWN